jgi:hypothetical protein
MLFAAVREEFPALTADHIDAVAINWSPAWPPKAAAASAYRCDVFGASLLYMPRFGAEAA